MEKIVHIVHHIDTEGPLHEPVCEVFNRIENTFGIKLDIIPSIKNLIKLQERKIEFCDSKLKNDIAKVLDPHLINFKSTWDSIDVMLYKILSKEYRNLYLDDFGNGLIYNWHIIDHVGFETNERRRDIGYLNIFNHYEQILKETNSKDDIQWHFHPISFFKEAHITATSYDNSMYELHQILSRRLIDKNWFPVVNRAGFHTVRPDSAFFLEQWMPFDASNQSVLDDNISTQVDAINGRYGDWAGAPSDWTIYNPDIYDWRKKGNSNRYISRVLNMKTRFRNVSLEEIDKAFLTADKTGNTYLGITNHDFRDMELEIDEFQSKLNIIRKKYPNVKVKNSTSIKAFRDVIGFETKDIENDNLDFEASFRENVLDIKRTNGAFFGPQPYLAIKTVYGKYYHDNFDFGKFKENYYYTFDRLTVPLHLVDTICVSSNDNYGNNIIVKITVNNGVVSDINKTINSYRDR
ncbi:hypothetical protein BZG01_03300 [Labilibaculum manganireducens]|uniref:Uncharacterized protein n=1 Tax=Labilibaculum manganireducens TaxID=1940525 RepID=A0A2N3IEN2_9BACT|nr:hypothetical protein [Labilibaculum manganireducens]PKQ68756.1 hypothetical protein BZG01_03300 [Labilibaculum manganireducens]